MFNPMNSDMFSSKKMKLMIQDLERKQLDSLISFIQERLKKLYNLGFSDERDTKAEILRGRFKKGLKCPKCGHTDLNKNGKMNGRQRYICKKCRITFDERSFSPLSNTRLSLEKWLKYCQLMIEGGTIKKCAEEINVSIPTSFFMRHRILDVLNLFLKNEILEGIVEVDTCHVNESFKGSSKKNNFENKKYFYSFDRDRLPGGSFLFNKDFGRSIKFSKNVKQNQICINTAIDRNGHILTRIVDNDMGINNNVKTQNMMSFFEGKLSENVIFCAYVTSWYRPLAEKLNIRVRQSPRPNSSIYTVNHVYKYHWELKRWLRNFNGVATKYLNNYLAWFKFLFISKKFTEFNRIKDLFMEFATEDLYLTQEMIKNRCVELL